MNAHQRRKAKRLRDRAFGDQVDYYVEVWVDPVEVTAEIDEPDRPWGAICAACGADDELDCPFDIGEGCPEGPDWV